MSSGGFGFESQGDLSGFQPAATGSAFATANPVSWGFNAPAGGSPKPMGEGGIAAEEYLDDEERERVERVI